MRGRTGQRRVLVLEEEVHWTGQRGTLVRGLDLINRGTLDWSERYRLGSKLLGEAQVERH